ncbi:hypothetical protein [Stratiformator vulcanicus]|uniref:Uncharacterized protein n=1 Tax=Stratiformator vulcanicus TaxID=2527980 RepID=A0A517R3M2_9PLAN|nr:hypothetical protein [Stratiformator vulcanicus]QDT38474.1 hypothetical protein Pan189_28680 [Stratiformator vulcanicus]
MNDSLKQYADELPPIYKDILRSFSRIDPNRRMGHGLAFQTIAADLTEKYGFGEIQAAGVRLVDVGLAEIKHGVFLHPTGVGEEVIACITGSLAPTDLVPMLSPPPSQ